MGGQQPAAAYRSVYYKRRKTSLSGSCRHSMKKQKHTPSLGRVRTETSTAKALNLPETTDEGSEICASATNTNTSMAGADEVGDTFAATPCEEERPQSNPNDLRSAVAKDLAKRLADKDLNTIFSVLERQLHFCRRICPDDRDCFLSILFLKYPFLAWQAERLDWTLDDIQQCNHRPLMHLEAPF